MPANTIRLFQEFVNMPTDHPTPEWEAWIAQRWRDRHNLPKLSDEEARKRFFHFPGYEGYWQGEYVGSEEARRRYALRNST